MNQLLRFTLNYEQKLMHLEVNEYEWITSPGYVKNLSQCFSCAGKLIHCLDVQAVQEFIVKPDIVIKKQD